MLDIEPSLVEEYLVDCICEETYDVNMTNECPKCKLSFHYLRARSVLEGRERRTKC